MTRLINLIPLIAGVMAAVVIAAFFGCASDPRTSHIRAKDGCYYWDTGEPVMTAAGKPWCDPQPHKEA